jgi:hypothetical protein
LSKRSFLFIILILSFFVVLSSKTVSAFSLAKSIDLGNELSHAAEKLAEELISSNIIPYHHDDSKPKLSKRDFITVAGFDLSFQSKLLQSVHRRLKNAGFNPGPYDENDLSLLSESVKRFQEVAKIEVNGLLDKETWLRLQKLYDPLESELHGGSKGSKKNEKKQSQDKPAPNNQYPLMVKKIALIDFAHENNLSEVANKTYNALSQYLKHKGFEVVDHSQIINTLKKDNLTDLSRIDTSAVQKIGKSLDSDVTIIGTISEEDNSLIIGGHLIDVQKSVTIAQAEVKLDKTPEIAKMIKKIDTDSDDKSEEPPVIEDKSDVKGSGSKTEEEPPTTGKPSGSDTKITYKPPIPAKEELPFFEDDLLKIEVISFIKEAESFQLKLKYFNKTKSPFSLRLSGPKENTYLIDEMGNQYVYKEAELFEFRDFPPHAPRISTITFRTMKDTGKEFIFSAKYEKKWNEHFFVSIEGIKLQ